MKKFYVSVLGAFLLAGAIAIAAPPVSGPSAENLWDKLDGYAGWQGWPGHTGMHPGKSPHGAFHSIHVNALGLNARELPLPDGAIVVKANYNEEKRLTALTVMYKVDGYAPENGDWFYAKYAPDGTVQAEGQPSGCVGCHQAVADSDYLFLRKAQ
ncbi:cytochrome P460 family protein [Desulfobaculum bizertense]|uniref:Cytochrome P460 n=1 Tax=Desulfobaculum bizertense DSM 18034 TaxID=1121442 RepID=A0A1T4W4Z1_9BACT|nr:cytochrome P460 family protein [Desulfobaculum bizertense]UIJ38639.1 cytochrome P460 family protein [Desulfobaculum bizertense]SKA72326.1 Cytochrome P460 [Desulfobaculum bizertense DSM 18034]